MVMTAGEEREALWARLEDLCARAARGEVVYTPFLSEKAVFYAASWLKPRGIPYAAYGGYADAERKRIWIFPDYMEEAASEPDFMPAGLSAYGAETDSRGSTASGRIFRRSGRHGSAPRIRRGSLWHRTGLLSVSGSVIFWLRTRRCSESERSCRY